MDAENKTRCLDRVRDHIAQNVKLMAIITDLPDLPGTLYAESTYLSLHIDYSITALRQVRRLLGPSWKFSYRHNASTGDISMTYTKDGIDMIVWLTKIGANCRKVKVSEVTYPVYKIVCES